MVIEENLIKARVVLKIYFLSTISFLPPDWILLFFLEELPVIY